MKRLFRIRLLLRKVEQTLLQNEGSFGEQVSLFGSVLIVIRILKRFKTLSRSLALLAQSSKEATVLGSIAVIAFTIVFWVAFFFRGYRLK